MLKKGKKPVADLQSSPINAPERGEDIMDQEGMMDEKQHELLILIPSIIWEESNATIDKIQT